MKRRAKAGFKRFNNKKEMPFYDKSQNGHSLGQIKIILLNGKFEKGTIMRSSMISWTLRFVTILAFVIAACNVVFAENAEQDSRKTEVLTTLEQRMQKRISVNFRNTPIEDVIRAMAGQADVDVLISPQVAGSVTATLTNVPLDEALNNILTAHGYGCVTTKNMIRVAPLVEIAEGAERLTNRIYRMNYADVKEVETALMKFISQRGSLSSNPGTSNIIVTDTESKIKAIDTFIDEIDRMTPQILVEARIYDITCKDRLDLGIEWEAGRNTTYASGATGGIENAGPNPTAGRTDPFMSGAFHGATANAEDTIGALRLGWLNHHLDIDAVLRAQKENINAKLLANPRVLVLDNETAKFKIISEIPYIELTESTGGGSFGTTEFREVGVELEVTPHLTRDEMIRLNLKPQFSIETGTVNVGGAGTTYPQPVVDRREADTTLLVKDGQTVVLGGLRKRDVSQQMNKVPLLGDIPLVGALFKFEGENVVTSELVVFITPRIIDVPVMSADEQKAYEATEFEGPEPTLTRAEAEAAEKK